MKRCILLLISMITLASGVSSADMVSDRAAIIDTMQAWEHAVESRNFDDLVAYYADNAIYYPNNASPVVGRGAIIERNRRRGSATRIDITQHVDDVTIAGDWALYSCLAEISVLASVDGASSTRYARVLLIMQKDAEGHWRIFRDIDNNTQERPK